jgi:ElaB/YqjD/DUF883 family membrane-anchored ribosome-binding protein
MNTESTAQPAGTKSPSNHEQIDKFLSDLKTVIRDGQELLKTGVGSVREKAISGAQSTERLVREKPYQSMGIIFGLGVLVGVMAVSMLSKDSSEGD